MTKKFNHRLYCRKEGKCIRCGRYICKGCNMQDTDGSYGICMVCNSKLNHWHNDTILPIRPLLWLEKPIRFYQSCNNDNEDELTF